MRLCLFVSLMLILTGGVFAAEKQDAKSPPAKPWTHTRDFLQRDVEGWTVLVEKTLLHDHPDLAEQGLRIMANQLYRLKRVVPEHAVQAMQTTKIWLQYKHPTIRSAQFHPSRQWLREHGFNLDKTGGVDIPNVQGFIRGSIRQPCLMLHELSHAYHCGTIGFGEAKIIELYENAKAAGKYMNVLNWWGKSGRHYAMTDHKEYFAESCEAYFGTNDFYPFVRSELKQFDPAMHDYLAKHFAPRPGKTDNAASSR